MFGRKITRPRDGRHKNNSSKGGTNEELYGRHENNLPKDGEFNGWQKTRDRRHKITRQRDEFEPMEN